MAILSPTAHQRLLRRTAEYDAARARLWRKHHHRVTSATDLVGWLQLVAAIDRIARRVALRKAGQ